MLRHGLSIVMLFYNDNNVIQFTRQWRITKRSNAIILNTTIGMLFYLILKTSNISQLYRKIIILIHSTS